MLLVPYVVGLSLAARHRPLGWGDVTLGLTWLIGYFAFNAAVLTLKSPAKRRAAFRAPLLAYGAASAAAGLGSLVLLGPELLWWAPLYAILLGVSLRLAATKRERSLVSGVLTVVASCLLMGVLRGTAGAPLTPPEVAVMVATTGYFVGTVFHVKSLIRERNDPASAGRNLWFHVALLACLGAGVVAGWLAWPWLVWAAALVARTLWLPRAQRRPLVIGLVEVAASLWLLGLATLA